MARIALRFVATLLVLAATPLAAQPWAGAAALGVEVKGGGSPVAGARVELYYLPDPQRGGPAAVSTDDRGEAEVYGLAEGRWFVRVRHPHYLTYEAEVVVSESRKPQEGLVARRKEGDSLETSKVRFVKLEGRPVPRSASGRSAEPPPVAEPRTTERPAATDERGAAPSVAPTTPTPTPPAPPVAPAAADSPAGPRILRSPHDGSCFDCQPGEWAAAAWGAARSGRPAAAPCPVLRDLAAALATELGDLGGYAGPLREPGTDEPLARLGSEAESTLRALFAPFADARCQVLAIRLPPGAEFRGFQLEAIDDDGPVPCQPGEECPAGAGAWTAPPVVERTSTGTIVVAGFENRAAARARQPRLTVYFVPRSDWRPVL
jgi:hypothetical protein